MSLKSRGDKDFWTRMEVAVKMTWFPELGRRNSGVQVPGTVQGDEGGGRNESPWDPLSNQKAVLRPMATSSLSSHLPATLGSMTGMGQVRKSLWSGHMVAMGKGLNGFLCPFLAATQSQSR